MAFTLYQGRTAQGDRALRGRASPRPELAIAARRVARASRVGGRRLEPKVRTHAPFVRRAFLTYGRTNKYAPDNNNKNSGKRGE